MKHESRNLGTIEYKQEDVFTFPMGILGFPGCTKFLFFKDGRTGPAQWLVSLNEGGPELALLDPSLVMEHGIGKDGIRKGDLRALGALSMDDLRVFCVLTVPDQIRRTSLNLRAPILLNPATKRGIEHVLPASSRQPVRRQVYGDLVLRDPMDQCGMVIAHRKVGETIEIGEDISVQVLELADGGVRLGVHAPRRIPVNRGHYLATPGQENVRANEKICMENLELLMGAFSQRCEKKGSVAKKAPDTLNQKEPARHASPGSSTACAAF